jgi:hypothetical protein
LMRDTRHIRDPVSHFRHGRISRQPRIRNTLAQRPE